MHHRHVTDEEFEALVQSTPDAVVTADDRHKFLVYDGVCHMAPLEQGSTTVLVATAAAATGGAAWAAVSVGIALALIAAMYLGVLVIAVWADHESRKGDDQ